jgi:DNA polymerase I-like protein with 3'-5' exonuclease and polymerase domains
MRTYGIDLETHDPFLTDKGPSWVYGEGQIICTGVYNAQTGKRTALDGNGGKAVRHLLTSPDVTLVGANLGYDLGWLCYEHKLQAKELRFRCIDIEIAEALIDEYQSYSLDALAVKYLNEHKGSEALQAIASSLGYRGDFRRHLQKLWNAGYRDEIRAYVISDADQPVRIWRKQEAILEETGCAEAAEVNFKLIRIVLGMKQRGVRIDLRKRQENGDALRKLQRELLPVFEKQYGQVNFNSPKQLASLFMRKDVPYEHRIRVKGRQGHPVFTAADVWTERAELKGLFPKLRVEKGQLALYVPRQYAARTGQQLTDMGYSITNNPSLAAEKLEPLKERYPVVQWVLDLKGLRFILDNFFGPNFERFIVSGRVHPDFEIVGARQTGRFSSRNPNGQNVPSRTVLFEGTEREIKVYKLCRECYLPDEGMWMGKLDFSGQENRLMAHFAVGRYGPYIRKKYNDNPDFDEHDLVGEESGLYAEHGRELGRKWIKNYRFGKAYGMQIPTMMSYFGWTRDHAEHMDTVFDRTAPWVSETMQKVSEVIVDRGYIFTVAKRRCHLERFNGQVNTRSAYKGFNKKIQGSGADLMKKAMVDLDEAGLLERYPLYLTVHDEIDIGVPKTQEALEGLTEVQYLMEHTYPLRVPMRVEPEIGPDWGHTEKLDKCKERYMAEAA